MNETERLTLYQELTDQIAKSRRAVRIAEAIAVIAFIVALIAADTLNDRIPWFGVCAAAVLATTQAGNYVLYLELRRALCELLGNIRHGY